LFYTVVIISELWQRRGWSSSCCNWWWCRLLYMYGWRMPEL